MDDRIVRRSMLNQPIDIQIDQLPNFEAARTIADHTAKKKTKDPMLLAWYDGKQGVHSPNISYGCQDKPSWLVYAQFRGGNIEVSINDQEYVFVYKDRSTYP